MSLSQFVEIWRIGWFSHLTAQIIIIESLHITKNRFLYYISHVSHTLATPSSPTHVVSSVDIDECSVGTHNCSRGSATCANVDGSYQCQCVTGYSGGGYDCTGKNSCRLRTSYKVIC